MQRPRAADKFSSHVDGLLRMHRLEGSLRPQPSPVNRIALIHDRILDVVNPVLGRRLHVTREDCIATRVDRRENKLGQVAGQTSVVMPPWRRKQEDY